MITLDIQQDTIRFHHFNHIAAHMNRPAVPLLETNGELRQEILQVLISGSYLYLQHIVIYLSNTSTYISNTWETEAKKRHGPDGASKSCRHPLSPARQNNLSAT